MAGGGEITGPTIVGEQGPELIMPNGRNFGTVIPNGPTQQMLGGQTSVVNYNINTIDSKSFEDRIYQSSGAIWAANQYAQKNINVTRSRT